MKELFIKIVRRILRIITSFLRLVFIKPIIYFPNLARENSSKKTLRDHNPELYKITENVFDLIHKKKFKFRGWSLAKSAIRYTILELFSVKRESFNIVELGGGVSTFFWYFLKKELVNIDFKITTFEHDKDWSEYLNKEVGSMVNILHCRLKQLSENERINLFEKPAEAVTNWQKTDKFLPENQYKTTRVRNVFYDFPSSYFKNNTKIDLLIVDGPHGNGRSMCFPLLKEKIGNGTIILLDDYNHYPFVDDLQKIFKVESLVLEDSYSKKWILLKVI
jgi:hypothetical protein